MPSVNFLLCFLLKVDSFCLCADRWGVCSRGYRFPGIVEAVKVGRHAYRVGRGYPPYVRSGLSRARTPVHPYVSLNSESIRYQVLSIGPWARSRVPLRVTPLGGCALIQRCENCGVYGR